MKVSEIYQKYNIRPNLQTHMLRVAAVASLICDDFQKPVDKKLIVTSMLLHDMGNMAKFKLEAFPEFLKPQGLEYWKRVQKDFIKKYGNNDYQATYKILNEIGVDSKILNLLKSIEFLKAPEIAKQPSFERKICQYSDLRVAPFGVLTLEERVSEVKERFMKNKGINEQQYDHLAESMRIIEKQVFAYTKIDPEFITDETINPLMDKLADFTVSA